VRYLEAPKTFREQLLEAIASAGEDDSTAQPDAFAAIARQPQEQLARAIGEVQSILAGPSIQARCLECASAMPAPRLRQRDVSLLGLLKAWVS
jgi:protease-4